MTETSEATEGEITTGAGGNGFRIAIPVCGGKLAEHFGHCDEFAIFHTTEDGTAIDGVVRVPAPPHQPGFLPVWLRGLGADVIIAGGMGRRAQDLFAENSIEVVLGVGGGDARTVAESYVEGTLVQGSNPCDH
jgi:predicted Fe-Mo cluster-binding NifX family protein